MKFQYTPWQQWTGNGWLARIFGGQWYPKASDSRLNRHLNTTVVSASEAREWPEGWGDLPPALTLSDTTYEGVMGGIPIQQVSSSLADQWTELDHYMGNTVRPVSLPLPKEGERWIEGMPRVGGAFDRHWIGIEDDNTAHEVTEMNDNLHIVANAAKWSPAGVLVDGPRGCNAAGIEMSAHLWLRGDAPHRLCMGLSDYGKALGYGDGQQDWEFPSCGQVVRLSQAKYDEVMAQTWLSQDSKDLATAMYRHGIVLMDRTGAMDKNGKPVPGGGLTYVSGAQNNGCTTYQLQSLITFKDLELVTEELS